MNRRKFAQSLAVSIAGLGLNSCHYEPRLQTTEITIFDKTAAARELSEHRLSKIESRILSNKYVRPVGRNARNISVGQGGLRKIHILTTDKGVKGWAQSYWPDESLQKFVGIPVAELFDIETGTLNHAIQLDQPMYDLVGNILNLPVYTLLGEQGPRGIPIYSGENYFDDLEFEDKSLGIARVNAGCQQDYDLGYRAFKLKIGRGYKWMPRLEGIQRDIEVTLAVREQFPNCKILVDANNGYAVQDLLTYLTAVKDCELFWIEEPFQEGREGLLRLREHMYKIGCNALIADGEGRIDKGEGELMPGFGYFTKRHIELLFSLASEQLIDVFLLDLNLVGFTNWRRIMPMLQQENILASPHTWASSLRTFYAAQLGAGVGNMIMVEGIPGSVEHVDFSAYRLAGEVMELSDAPGFGLSLDVQ